MDRTSRMLSELDYLQSVPSLGLGLLDRNLRYVRVNEALAALNGKPVSAHIGRTIGEVIPELAPRIEPLCRQVLMTEQAVSGFELRAAKPAGSGEARNWLVTCFPVKGDGGELVGVGAVVEDITERKLAEEKLRESKRRLATLMSNLPGMVYQCRNDEQWTMDFVSGGCRALTGHDPGDLLGNRKVSYAELMHEEDREGVRTAVEAALAARGAFETTYRIITAGGEERWVWERGRGVFQADGELVALEGFITDVTERRRAEEERGRLEAQLQQAQKLEAIGRLAGGVAHDFNNLLLVILANAELTQDELRRAEPDRGHMSVALQQIEQAVRRATALTRQLLAFSRQQHANPEVLDLNEVLTELTKMLRRLIGEDVNLDLRLGPNVPHVRMDPGQLEQVIMNLVVNARDAMPAGGSLTIETTDADLEEAHCEAHPGSRPGPHAVVVVRDTGCGMDEEMLERVFEPFFTTKPVGEGTGLGLSTVYGIVRLMEGHVNVESKVEEGTTFSVYLPATDAGLTPAPAVEAGGEGLGGMETVLVCEDDPAVRAVACNALRRNGYTVLEAAYGEAAIEMAARHTGPIDLLLTDVVLPGRDGRFVAETLQSQRVGIKVLYVSGYTAHILDQHDLSGEHVELIQKPFTLRKLLVRVRDILDRV